MRQRRRALSPAEQRRHALGLAAHTAGRRWFRSARRIALYRASDGEIDPAPLLRLALRQGKAVFLPRLDPDGRMRFARYRPGDRLVPNRYGILQPRASAQTAGVDELDVVFMPLVGFTREGRRLGMGGGYYDRALARARRARRVGLAHSCQQADSLPADPWDVEMTAVLTEKGTVWPPSRASNPSV